MESSVIVAARVRERYVRRAAATEAVVHGVRTVAGVLAGASLVLVPMLVGMASGRGVIGQQGSFALGVALVLDALLVRMVVLPAARALIGPSACIGGRRSVAFPSDGRVATPNETWRSDWSGRRVGAGR